MPKSSWHYKPEGQSDYYEEHLQRAHEERRKKRGESALSGILDRARQAFAPGIPTGFSQLDKAVRFAPGRLLVLGARPGVGKTTIATQIAVQVLTKCEGRVIYCSVEMEAAEIGIKALSCLSGVNCVIPFEQEDELAIEYVYTMASQASPTLGRLQVCHGTELSNIIEVCRDFAKDEELPLRMVIIDFITNLKPIGEYPTKAEAVGSITTALKQLAKELSIPVLACAQLNRGTAPNKRPSMKDLKDSGQIEQDADVVMLLHRVEDENKVELIIDKNRFGQIATLTMYPELELHRFRAPNPIC
jgi:replicative DNA helicase